jgi:hypothetical protein
MTSEWGPFATEREARSAPAATETAAEVTRLLGQGKRAPDTRAPRLDLLAAQCRHAGIEIGDYDLRLLQWLSGWETEMVMAAAGIIRRAFDAGRASQEG